MLTPTESIAPQISRCMLIDQHRFRRALGQIEAAKRANRPADREAQRLAAAVQASVDRRERRAANRPKIAYPEELPVTARRDEIAKAISENQVVILCGETGSGKTTQLPKICLELGRGVAGMIGHTQPRRIAARTVAARVAQELSTQLGKTVGYKVRFGDKTSDETLVKVMTDGILLAETQGDRFLDQYDTLIIDEAHERSLNIDFLLGILRQLLPRRPDLKLIITSATIDPQRFARHFAQGGKDAPIVEVSGRTYPVEVHYRPLVDAAANEEDEEPDMLTGILRAVDEADSLGRGDALIFLSGEREIRDTADTLRKRFHETSGTEILPLYSRLSNDEQNRAFTSRGKRRIVLATNVAETSLTVPGIRYVIDPGVARISRYSARSKVQRLPIEAISRASADQRKGRCGRVGPGVCFRLYSEEDFTSRDEFTQPEILRTNLAGVILQMKALRLGDVDKFPFIEPPDPRLIRDGYQTLRELGAVDERNELTPIGRELARLPVDPRIGRMLIAAREENCLHDVLIIAAALSLQDPRERPMDKQQQADEAHAPFRDETSDVLSYLKLWEAYHEQRRTLSRNQAAKWCKQHFLSVTRMREWLDLHQQLRAMVEESAPVARRVSNRAAPPQPIPVGDNIAAMLQAQRAAEAKQLQLLHDAIHRALLAGLLANVGTRGETHEFAGARGSKFFIFPGSSLFKKAPRWLAAAEIVETTRLYARTVFPIHPEWIERLAPHMLERTYSEPHWDKQGGFVRAFERVTLFGLPLIPRRAVNYGPINPKLSRDIFIRHALVLGEYRVDSPFAQHNRELVEEIESLEAKQRKRDLLKDDHARFAFFDARVPGTIVSGPMFEQWRWKAEKSKSRLLFMERTDLMHRAAPDITPDRYPDSWPINQMTLPLDYRLEPGNPADGVTLETPLAALNQLHPEPFDWLVPGMLKEKIVALIKALPKHLRVAFVPAPQTADAVLERFAAVKNARGSLLDRLAGELGSMAGIEVRRSDFDLTSVDEYLRMNFRVLDERGRTLGMSRDLVDLQRRLGAEAAGSFGSVNEAEFTRDNLTVWNFGDLPELVNVRRAGVMMQGYPALSDKGNAVSLRLYDSPGTASSLMRGGLRRLFALQLATDLKQLGHHIPNFPKLTLKFAPLGSAGDLRKQLLDLSVDRVYLGDNAAVRTHMEFELRLRERYHRLPDAIRQSCGTAALILDAYQIVALQLADKHPASWTLAIKDIREQIAVLMAPGFIANTPWQWLQQFPRYLKAIQLRLQKLTNAGLTRDAKHMADFAPQFARYLERLSHHRARTIEDPELLTLRWMLEELRVAYYAQELGTVVPVSAKKMDQQWERVRM